MTPFDGDGPIPSAPQYMRPMSGMRWCDECEVGSSEQTCWFCGGEVRIGSERFSILSAWRAEVPASV